MRTTRVKVGQLLLVGNKFASAELDVGVGVGLIEIAVIGEPPVMGTPVTMPPEDELVGMMT